MTTLTQALSPDIVRHWSALSLAERERTAPPIDFPPLPDLAPGRYTDPAFFALEQARLWRRSWLYAGHIDQLPAAGSYFLWQRGSASIVVMRGDDGEIRAFYNTCRHRGAPILQQTEGRAGPSLVCGYHGWSYDRAGRQRMVTEPRDWPPAPACRHLIAVRCERVANWIFVCEDLDAGPLAEFLEPVLRYIRHLPLNDLRLVNRRVLEVKCNIKVLVENFLEAYHFKLLHPRTSDRIFDNQGTSIHLWKNGHSMMLSPNRRSDWIDPGSIGMPEMASATRIEREFNPSYSVFPNFILPIAASGMPAVVLWPKTLRTSSMEVLWFAPDWGGGPRDPRWEIRIANFDRIAEEDILFAEPMQHSIESPGFRGVPLSYQERRIYHWHEELDRRIGIEQIPVELRVEPRLAALLE